MQLSQKTTDSNLDKRADNINTTQKICYIVTHETVFNNGIIESQVLNLLPEVEKIANSRVELCLMVIIPVIHVNRSGIAFNLVKYRREISQFKKRMTSRNISVIVMPSLMFRFGIHLPILHLIWFSLFSFPVILAVLKNRNFNIIHCRSYVSAFSGMIAKKVLGNVKLIFDVRGLYPEEGIIQGKWGRDSISFRLWKKLERWLLDNSDAIISVSDTFTKHLKGITKNDKIIPIYFATDSKNFAIGRRNKMQTSELLGLKNRIVFAYNGGLGSWHDPILLAKIFSHINTTIRGSHLIVFTNYNKDILTNIFRNNGIPKDKYTIMELSPSDVPLYLPACDYGIAPSQEASSSNDEINKVLDTMIGIKISEYLSSGLPIIVNENIGGIASIMNNKEIGIRFSTENIDDITPKLLKVHKNYVKISENALEVAERFFNFNVCANSYYQLYRNLANNIDN